MKLSEYLNSGNHCFKKAKLLKCITLDNGEKMKKGEIGDLLLKFKNGTYHFENNDSACIVKENEIQIL